MEKYKNKDYICIQYSCDVRVQLLDCVTLLFIISRVKIIMNNKIISNAFPPHFYCLARIFPHLYGFATTSLLPCHHIPPHHQRGFPPPPQHAPQRFPSLLRRGEEVRVVGVEGVGVGPHYK